MNAERKLLEAIRQELQDMGVGTDNDINGGDAVEYLGDLYEAISDFLKVPS